MLKKHFNPLLDPRIHYPLSSSSRAIARVDMGNTGKNSSQFSVVSFRIGIHIRTNVRSGGSRTFQRLQSTNGRANGKRILAGGLETKQNHGSDHRLFNDQHEAEIAEVVVGQYVERGHLYTSAPFVAAAKEKWKELGSDLNQFTCSHKFIGGSQDKTRFSSRRCHMKRRDPARDAHNVEDWIQRIRDLIETYRHFVTKLDVHLDLGACRGRWSDPAPE
jgi:hypothetical protein